jgi:isoleucyl-tRNA synthetase
MDLRSTLNLPDPNFTIPMRANLPSLEPEIQKRWEEIKVYHLIQNARRGRPKFLLHDGPPYTNSPIHIGTALNKALKDFVVKYKTLCGYHSPYVPGYDTHGLPIELAVQKESPHNLTPSQMRQACREHARRFIQIQTQQFKRLGVFGDWENAYATMDPGFESAIIRAFAQLVREGYIYRDLRPTHWSIHSRTALADTELVYEEHTSQALYVRFPLKEDPKGVLSPFAPRENTYALIWTTTPWTIPGNLALAFHPDLDYALVKSGDEFYLVALTLREKVFQEIQKPVDKTVTTLKGASLEGLRFQHPLFPRESLGVLADYVKPDEGTGIVHTAPGHGHEDFATGRKYGLPILCPVDEAGVFTQEAGEFAGIPIYEAENLIISRLKEEGHLLLAYEYLHAYPYSERDKHPVIFRTTEQWFLNVDHKDLRRKALQAIKNVRWFPRQGETRISAMVETRPDWCLSRQRVWGVGIPIFYGKQSKKPVLDPELIEKVAQVVEQKGLDAWFDEPVSRFIPEGYRHPETGETEFTKDPDVLDVWFDSGITHYAVLKLAYNPAWKDLHWPADLYLEGSDQHRGWFNSSLMTAMALQEAPPYREVLTHGFVVDEAGERMSKSKGNVVDPVEVVNQFGADILRLWAGTVDYRGDVRCGPKHLEQVGEMYRRLRNTLRFLLANLYDFDPATETQPSQPLDLWAVAQTQKLLYDYVREMNEYDFSAATAKIHNFCVRDLSAFYLDAIKDTMYCDPKDSPTRRSAQTACYFILTTLTCMLAPFIPHTAEEVYQKIPLKSKHPTVFLETFSCPTEEDVRHWKEDPTVTGIETFLQWKDRLYSQMETWKHQAGVKDSQEISVQARVPESLYETLTPWASQLATWLKVSEVQLIPADTEHFAFAPTPHLKCARCWLHRPDVAPISLFPSLKEKEGEGTGTLLLCKRCAQVVSS